MKLNLCKSVILLLAILLSHVLYANDSAFDQNYGISLLHEEKYDEAEAYFGKHLKGNAVAYYGVALSKFRKDAANITIERTKEISALYEKAIQLSPGFSDAYFMCAISYYVTARLQFIFLESDKTPNKSFDEPDALLEKAEAYLNKTIVLEPQFAGLVEQEREKIKQLKMNLSILKNKK